MKTNKLEVLTEEKNNSKYQRISFFLVFMLDKDFYAG